MQSKWNNGKHNSDKRDSVFTKIKPDQFYFLFFNFQINIIHYISKNINIKSMDKQDQTANLEQEKLISQLRQFGFQQNDILKALKYTSSKQIAAEIIVKLIEEGHDADLSMYKQEVSLNNNHNKEEPNKTNQMYNIPSRPKMLFVINGQLKMGKGKICAQVGHAVIGAYLQIQQQSKFDQRSANRLKVWENSGSPKVVVKAQTEKQMTKIQKQLQGLKIGINTYLVQDAGHTQIKAGSKTVLAIGPAFSNEIDSITEHLKLV